MADRDRWDPLHGHRARPRGRWATTKQVAGALAGFGIALLLGTAMILAIADAVTQ